MRYGLAYPPNNRMWYERPQGTGYALSLAGGTMEGPVYLWREPRYPTEAASKAYVDFAVGNTGGPFLSINGGHMRGPLLLNHDPVSMAEAATRNYVDRAVARATLEHLSIRGGRLDGALLLPPLRPSDPDDAAVTKDYVDNLAERLLDRLMDRFAERLAAIEKWIEEHS